MGFSLSWIAIQKPDKQKVWDTMQVERVSKDIALQRKLHLVGGLAANGWYLIHPPHRASTPYTSEEMAARLSATNEVLVYSVVEGCNYCSLKCWKDGTEAWAVIRGDDSGKGDRYNVFVSGNPPEELDGIREYYEHIQKEDDDCDYLMEVPTDFAQLLTGYRHDRFIAVTPEEFASLEKQDTTDYLVPRSGTEPIIDNSWLMEKLKPELEKIGFSNFEEPCSFVMGDWNEPTNSARLSLLAAGTEYVAINPGVSVRQEKIALFMKDLADKGIIEQRYSSTLSIKIDYINKNWTPRWEFKYTKTDETQKAISNFVSHLKDEIVPKIQRCFDLSLSAEDVERLKNGYNAQYALIAALILSERTNLAKELAFEYEKEYLDQNYKRFVDFLFN